MKCEYLILGRSWSPFSQLRPCTYGKQHTLNLPEFSTELLYTLANSPYRMSPDYRVIIGDSRRMSEVTDESVHLTVTSPPYPMVSIWDDFFAEASAPSYNKMHEYLNETWQEVSRVLVPGGIACINIGDATRSSNGIFHLYPNHSRIIENFEKLGFVTLPYVLWKKPTNRPHSKRNRAFLGSEFLPT